MARAMSREEMVKVIRSGQSVSFGGRIIRDEKDLPEAHEIAGSPAEKRAALRSLHDQREDLNQQIRRSEEDLEKAEREEEQEAAERRAKGGPPPRAPSGITDRPPGMPMGQHQNARQHAAGGQQSDKDKAAGGEEPHFAGKPLSHYRKIVDKHGDDQAAAKQALIDEPGVGEATAEKIIEALDDED